MRTRIKMCGITSVADALAAVNAGADALGLVFYAPSKRAVEIAQAAEIARAVPAYVSVVGLFVDADAAFVREICAQVALDELQFHGGESPDYCSQFGYRFTKAVPMNEMADVAAVQHYMAQYPYASGFLLDAFGGGKTGGSGKTFDWSNLPQSDRPLIIAGGLHSDNVGELIKQCRPYAVDVSSGIESAPGRKCTSRMREFVRAVMHVI
ncbi:phosphoribosylanthranilate isomerase [Cardiobacteriaceae bacterium TAE3-ERU3]|nr:phosphoribosylanthranilate isomerase [Cardiobacteriaceae bacterium TAE3-ERU3]